MPSDTDSPHVEILLGPPGTGKTAALTTLARRCMETGTAPSRIGFLSFSRAAVAEALGRMGGTRDEYPWFRTIHSLGYALAGITHDGVVSESRLLEFSRQISEPISSTFATASEGGSDHGEMRVLNAARGAPADVALTLYSKACAKTTTLEHEYRLEHNLAVDWHQVRDIIGKYTAFKVRNRLWDFSDLVTKSAGVLDCDKLFIDEAQDTTRAQWNLIRRVVPRRTDIVLAGDDDQLLYRWCGADSSPLATLHAHRTILRQSYRVASNVRAIATRVADRIPNRIPKPWVARTGDAGVVESVTDLSYVDLAGPGHRWLLMARTRYHAAQWRARAHEQGVVYQLENGGWSNGFPEVKAALAYWELQKGGVIERGEVDGLYRFLPTQARVCQTFQEIRALPETVEWADVIRDVDKSKVWWHVLEMSPEDAGYVRALRQHREHMTGPGRIRISTVHRAKGLEEDNVGVLMSLPRRVALAPDPWGDELRVLYVALTRARHRMVLAYVPSNYQWSVLT